MDDLSLIVVVVVNFGNCEWWLLLTRQFRGCAEVLFVLNERDLRLSWAWIVFVDYLVIGRGEGLCFPMGFSNCCQACRSEWAKIEFVPLRKGKILM